MTKSWLPKCAIAGLFLVLCSQTAAAEPPAGDECLYGYQPSAVVNVCYEETEPATYNVPTVLSIEQGPPVCIVGDVCAPNPQPQLLPGGSGKPVTVPALPLVNYVEVAGHGVDLDAKAIGDCFRPFAQGVVQLSVDLDAAVGGTLCAAGL